MLVDDKDDDDDKDNNDDTNDNEGKPHGNIVNFVTFLNDEANGEMLMLLVWFFLFLLVDDIDSNNEIGGQKYNDEVENVHKDEDDN